MQNFFAGLRPAPQLENAHTRQPLRVAAPQRLPPAGPPSNAELTRLKRTEKNSQDHQSRNPKVIHDDTS